MERFFRTYTIDEDQSYELEVKRIDNEVTAKVSVKMPKADVNIERVATFAGDTAEQEINAWLEELDKEVQAKLGVLNKTQEAPAVASPD